jgi:hypothetical protein
MVPSAIFATIAASFPARFLRAILGGDSTTFLLFAFG